jgi:predicted small integral membrane protein
MLRIVQMAGVFTVAAFFTLVVAGNVLDYGANYAFVQHVLTMDTTLKNPALMGRAITAPWAHEAAYVAIIAWEALAGLLAWIGLLVMLYRANADPAVYDRAKRLAILGCLAGFFLFFFGFIVVAGEWFAMWQSKDWNAQATAFYFSMLIGLVLLFLLMREQRPD